MSADKLKIIWLIQSNRKHFESMRLVMKYGGVCSVLTFRERNLVIEN